MLLITNPSNPVGAMLSREQIKEMIEFCHKYNQRLDTLSMIFSDILYRNQLHYVSDEIYINSVHSESAEFVSALSIDK